MLASTHLAWPSFQDRPSTSDLSEGSIRFSEFSLTTALPIRQLSMTAENPLCRLASRTAEGRTVCNKGCALTSPADQERHICPFGLFMRRMEERGAQGAAHWIGRRFLNAIQMHEGLDRLVDAGLDEDAILAHLPPNPIADEDEIRLAALGTTREREAVLDPRPENVSRLDNLLEYVEQVFMLISTVERPTGLCDRFLRALTGMLPFAELSIYLWDREREELVLAATADHEKAHFPYPRPQSCRLEPEGLGAKAFHRRLALAERGDRIETLHDSSDQARSIAFPLVGISGECLGVWIAACGDRAYPDRLGHESLRVMRLLSRILAMRLQAVKAGDSAPAPADRQPEGKPAEDRKPDATELAGEAAWNRETMLKIVSAEAARASRTGSKAALLRLQLRRTSRAVDLPLAELTRVLQVHLRPYDRAGLDEDLEATWNVLVANADPSSAATAAERLIEAVEDFMDAGGGTEEQGLRLGVGISLWGMDAAGAEEMVQHSTEALARAFTRPLDERIQKYLEDAPVRKP